MPDRDLTDDLRQHLLSGVPAEPPSDRIDTLRAAAEAKRAAPLAAQAVVGGSRVVVEDELEERRRIRRSPIASGLIGIAAAVLLLAAGFGFGRALSDNSAEGNLASGVVEFQGVIEGPGGRGELSITKTGIGRIIDLETSELPILPTGEFYEVWFVNPDGVSGTPDIISAGTFHPDVDGRTTVSLAAAVDPTIFPLLQITAEPADGDPTPNGSLVLEADLRQ